MQMRPVGVALAGLWVAAAGFGCAHARVDAEAERKAVMEADARFSADVGARGVEAWAEAFAEDGRMLPNGQPVIQGHEQIREAMANLGDPRKAPPALTLVWKPVFAGVSDDGTLGWTIGSARGKGPKGEFLTKYVTVWRKQADGSWKVAVDCGTQGEAVPGSAP